MRRQDGKVSRSTVATSSEGSAVDRSVIQWRNLQNSISKALYQQRLLRGDLSLLDYIAEESEEVVQKSIVVVVKMPKPVTQPGSSINEELFNK